MPGKTEPHYQLSVQERDLALLRGLFESRVMTAEHIVTIYFDGRSEAGKKRLQKLKVAGFVGERTRRAFQPSVLFLTRKGPVRPKGERRSYRIPVVRYAGAGKTRPCQRANPSP
jgi:hypothetical protein